MICIFGVKKLLRAEPLNFDFTFMPPHDREPRLKFLRRKGFSFNVDCPCTHDLTPPEDPLHVLPLLSRTTCCQQERPVD